VRVRRQCPVCLSRDAMTICASGRVKVETGKRRRHCQQAWP
jgi:hypothetical protein